MPISLTQTEVFALTYSKGKNLFLSTNPVDNFVDKMGARVLSSYQCWCFWKSGKNRQILYFL